MPTLIAAERPDTVDAATLLRELAEHLGSLYVMESRDPDEQLLQESVAFFVMRHDGEPACCGGVKLFGTEYGEIKRMYVRPRFRGLGLGKRMLSHLTDHARQQGVRVLRLMTGIHQPEALRMYERCGFQPIPPFGAYQDDPLSVFFEKRLTEPLAPGELPEE